MGRVKEILTGEGTTPVQAEIPGTEQSKIPALERAADKYYDTRRTWQGLGEELANHKAKVIELMHTHRDAIANRDEDVLVYIRGDYKISLSAKESVKVKIAKDDEEGFDA